MRLEWEMEQFKGRSMSLLHMGKLRWSHSLADWMEYFQNSIWTKSGFKNNRTRVLAFWTAGLFFRLSFSFNWSMGVK